MQNSSSTGSTPKKHNLMPAFAQMAAGLDKVQTQQPTPKRRADVQREQVGLARQSRRQQAGRDVAEQMKAGKTGGLKSGRPLPKRTTYVPQRNGMR